MAVETDARLRAETAAQEAGGGASCSPAFRCLLWETGRLEGAASAACWPLPSAAVEVADLGCKYLSGRKRSPLKLLGERGPFSRCDAGPRTCSPGTRLSPTCGFRTDPGDTSSGGTLTVLRRIRKGRRSPDGSRGHRGGRRAASSAARARKTRPPDGRSACRRGRSPLACLPFPLVPSESATMGCGPRGVTGQCWGLGRGPRGPPCHTRPARGHEERRQELPFPAAPGRPRPARHARVLRLARAAECLQVPSVPVF